MDKKYRPGVLVVHDVSDNRACWRDAFDRAGFRVIEADNRANALKYLEGADSEVRLLVTGLMRDAEGAQLVADVADRCPNFPFIVVAQAANPVGIHGHFAILLEPVSDEELIETAKTLLSK